MQMPELGYLRSVHRSVLDALQLTITLASQSRFEDAARECKRVAGALHMSKFEGAARLMDDAGDYALLASKGSTESSAGKPLDVLTIACKAARQYILDALANAPDVPMKLWEAYRLVKMGKRLGAHPSQLFFPKMKTSWESKNTQKQPSAEAFLLAREKLSVSLTRWMKDSGNKDELLEVQKIIKGVLAAAPLSASHVGFFITALAAIDTVMEKSAPDAFDRLVLGRVDAEMKYLSEGSAQPTDDGWRYLLYVVAFGGADTDVVKVVKEKHELDEYSELIKQEARRQGVTLDEEMLMPIKEALNNVKDAWSKFATGVSGVAEMEKYVQILSDKLPAFEHPAITRLGSALLKITHGLKAQQVSLSNSLIDEIAAILMLLEQAVDAKGRVSEQFEARTISQIRRTLAAVKNDSAALSEMPETEVDDEVKVRSRRVLREQVLLEVKLELQAAESALDAWFKSDEDEEGNAEEVLKTAQPLKRLVHVLQMTQLPHASRVLSEVLQSLQLIVGKSRQVITGNESQVISEKMAALSLYLDAEITEQDNALRFLGEVTPVAEALKKEELVSVSDFKLSGEANSKLTPEKSVKVIEFTAQPKAAVVSIEGDIDVIADTVMLEVFLEDFDDQMETLKRGSLALSHDQQNKAALVDIRRAFHTLKGSGRMITGLVRLPNVAEKIESFLKRWISEERAATQQLMGAIEDAINTFDGWKTDLQKNGQVEVHGGDITKAFSASEYPEYAHPVVKENEDVIVDSSIKVPDKVFVGTMVVDFGMYTMYLQEAGEQIQTLRNEWTFTKNSPKTVVSREFMRAGHTLGSTSKTLGFKPIAELGYLIERWSEKRMEGGSWIGQKETADVEALIVHIERLYEAVKSKDQLVLDNGVVSTIEDWLRIEVVKNVEVQEKAPSWAAPSLVDKELRKKLADKLTKEIASVRSHLGELESMLMLLDVEDEKDVS